MARVTLKSTNVGTLYCDWSSSQDVTNNRSTVTLKMIFVTASGYTIGPWSSPQQSYLGTTSMTFDGAIPNFSGTRTLTTKTMTVNHNADGTGSATIRWKWGVNSSWGGYVYPSGSFNITLPTIPRASQPTLSASTVEMGKTVTIYTNRASSAFKHTIKFKCGSYSATIATGVATSYTYTTQLAMANQVPNGTSVGGTFTVDTYNGSTLVGSKTVNVTLTVPSSIKPSISGANVTETGSGLGIFVQTKSKFATNITATGSYGSSISEYSTVIEGVTYKGKSFTSNVINGSGNITVSVTVKDSRGRTATYSRTVSVYAYTKPLINAFSAYRCTQDGTPSDSGSCIKFSYNFAITTLDNKNGKIARVQYKQNDSETWLTALTLDTYILNDSYVSQEFYDPNHSYDVRLYLEDSFNNVSSQLLIGTDIVTIDYLAGGKGVSIGKVAELENTFDVQFETRMRNDLHLDGVFYPNELGNYLITPFGYGRLQSYNDEGDRAIYIFMGGDNMVSIGSNLDGVCAYKVKAGNVISDPNYPAFYPSTNGNLYLGLSSNKWRAVYATNGTIQTSDRKLKHDIKSIDDKYIALFNALKPIRYMMNDGDRIHIGFISQDVEEAMQEVGLSDLEFAGFCKDKKRVLKKEIVKTESGEEIERETGKLEDVLDEDGNPEYTYSLRYEEFIALNTRKIQDLMAKVEEQAKRIYALEAEIKAIKDL